MLLDSLCYQALIAYLIYRLGIAEYDQVVGPVLADVVNCVVQLPRFQE